LQSSPIEHHTDGKEDRRCNEPSRDVEYLGAEDDGTGSDEDDAEDRSRIGEIHGR
jgi:hypothetical protein